jgi:dsRNA-specific ribonuclease
VCDNQLSIISKFSGDVHKRLKLGEFEWNINRRTLKTLIRTLETLICAL